MFVRIAKFEGADGNWDERIEDIRSRLRRGGDGTAIDAVRGSVKRAMLLVDRESGGGSNIIFCEIEEDLRRVDDAMNQMSRPRVKAREHLSTYMKSR